jgi:hypothetical protein
LSYLLSGIWGQVEAWLVASLALVLRMRVFNRNCLSAILGRSHEIMAWGTLRAVARTQRWQQTTRTQRRLTFTPKPRPNQNSNPDHPKTVHLGDVLCFLRVDATVAKHDFGNSDHGLCFCFANFTLDETCFGGRKPRTNQKHKPRPSHYRQLRPTPNTEPRPNRET